MSPGTLLHFRLFQALREGREKVGAFRVGPQLGMPSPVCVAKEANVREDTSLGRPNAREGRGPKDPDPSHNILRVVAWCQASLLCKRPLPTVHTSSLGPLRR